MVRRVPGVAGLFFLVAAFSFGSSLGRLPMAFERRDHGYFARGLGYQVGLSDRGVRILGPDSAIELGFAGGTLSALTAGAPLPGKVNYLRGSDPKKWRLSVPTYDRVTYHEVYPGIDAVFYGNQSQLEFDLVIRPGADAAKVRLRLGGAGKLKLDEGGVSSESGFRLPRPTVYQGSR